MGNNCYLKSLKKFHFLEVMLHLPNLNPKSLKESIDGEYMPIFPILAVIIVNMLQLSELWKIK